MPGPIPFEKAYLLFFLIKKVTKKIKANRIAPLDLQQLT